MRITPLDVRKQEFRKVVRGLDPEEVYAFLATVADEYEVVLTDNKQLREQTVSLDEKVKEYRNMEIALRDTMMTAERVTTDSRANAEKEASLILEKARVEAQRETASISSRVESLRHQLRELKTQRDAFLTRLRTLSETQLNLLGNYERDFEGDDRHAMNTMAASGPADPPAAPAPAPAPMPSPAPAPVAPQTATPSGPVSVADPTAPRPVSAPVAPVSPAPNQYPVASAPPVGPAAALAPGAAPTAVLERPVDEQPTKPIPTFAGVPTPGEDHWRNYAVGSEGQPAVPEAAPRGPVDTMVDVLPTQEQAAQASGPHPLDAAEDLTQAVQDAAGGPGPLGGQSGQSVATSASNPSESEDSTPTPPDQPGKSGWSMQRFTSGLQG